MNNKLPISCFIIAQDEADRINNTIESVIDIVDEVIVIDSGSTDGTCKSGSFYATRGIITDCSNLYVDYT